MKRIISLGAVMGIALGASACREEGPMEEAGRQVDEAIEEIRHGDEGSLEHAGRQVDEAIDDAEKKLKE